jgi:hypothetical protein
MLGYRVCGTQMVVLVLLLVNVAVHDLSLIKDKSWTFTKIKDFWGRRFTYYRVQIKARIELRSTYHYNVDSSLSSNSYLTIMQNIANFFGVNVYSRTRFLFEKNHDFYIVDAHSFNSHKIVSSYFTQFPLFSSKYFNYLRWLEIHQMQLRGAHNTLEGLQRCREIKAESPPP